MLGDLLGGGAGARLCLDACGVEMLNAASLRSREQFIKLRTMVALAGGLGREFAQQGAGALEDVGGEGDGFVSLGHHLVKDGLDSIEVCRRVADDDSRSVISISNISTFGKGDSLLFEKLNQRLLFLRHLLRGRAGEEVWWSSV